MIILRKLALTALAGCAFAAPARASSDLHRITEPHLAAEFFQQSFEPGAVTTGLETNGHGNLELLIKSSQLFLVLVLELSND